MLRHPLEQRCAVPTAGFHGEGRTGRDGSQLSTQLLAHPPQLARHSCPNRVQAFVHAHEEIGCLGR